jgi:tripartite-type tricarboxylate transporter receptor subunit TctC
MSRTTGSGVQKNMEANEFDVVANSPEEFAKFLKREAETWGRVAKQAGLVAE